jgi:hypothetical protein
VGCSRNLSAYPSARFSRTCRVRWQGEVVDAEAPEAGREFRLVAAARRASFGCDRSVGREKREGRKRPGNDPARVVCSGGRLSDVTDPLAERSPQNFPTPRGSAIPRAPVLWQFGRGINPGHPVRLARSWIGFVWSIANLVERRRRWVRFVVRARSENGSKRGPARDVAVGFVLSLAESTKGRCVSGWFATPRGRPSRRRGVRRAPCRARDRAARAG